MTRPTEVQLVLMNKGMERGTAYLLSELFEKHAALQQDVTHLAQSLDMMANMLSQVVDGASAIRKEVERMQGGVDDDAPNASG